MDVKKDMGVKKKVPLMRTSNKNKIRKKKRFSIDYRKIFPEIVEYLKSDSYFYSHFISSSTASNSSAQYDVFSSSRGEPILGSKGRAKEKLVEYLKSDTYLYAPLEGTQGRDDFAIKKIISPQRGHDLQFMRVTSTVLSTSKIAWQTKEVAEKPSVVEKCRDHGTRGIPPDENFASPKTPGLQEVKKQAARRSGRLSTISG
ncbi:hypothetical protein BVRB_8g192130 [Beta vulgaris subsp. vulgaris]|nr:hypothetical protein BVRB_8g192130 [Beta vulgaris subsp. vulgaris]